MTDQGANARAGLTLRDIAAAANVSVAAVSQALNNTGNLGADTRERIQRIASELGYTPNKFAAALRRRKTMSIGFVANTGEANDTQRRWSGHYGAQLNALATAAAAHDFTITVLPENRPQLLAGSRVDAIFIPDGHDGGQILAAAQQSAVPVVTTDTQLDYLHAIRVDPGYRAATRDACERFRAAGARRPALLTGPVAGAAAGEHAYLDWCREHRIEPLIARPDADDERLSSRLHELIHLGADAVFSLIEHGPSLFIALERDGVLVPRDVQLIALCVDECAANARLDISHVCVHPEQAPDAVMTTLIAAIDSPSAQPVDVALPWHSHDGATTRPQRATTVLAG